MFRRVLVAVALSVGLLTAGLPAAHAGIGYNSDLYGVSDGPPVEGLLWERWTGIKGTSIEKLLNDPGYPNDPDITTIWMGDFDIPGDLDTGNRLRGFIVPSVTDTYTLWVVSDNHSEVYVSADADPANLINGGA
ncbi:MAG: hypothetical protein GY788_15335, partial [bacterium]|nr:hypothetical protein [bacterium]